MENIEELPEEKRAIISKIEKEVRGRGLSEYTLTNYIDLAKKVLRETELTPQAVEEWIKTRVARGEISTNSARTYYISLQVMLKILNPEWRGFKDDGFKQHKEGRVERPHFTPEEMTKIIKLAKDDEKGGEGLKGFSTFLQVLWETGCRAGELHNTERGNLVIIDGEYYLNLTRTKNDEPRTVGLSKKNWDALRKELENGWEWTQVKGSKILKLYREALKITKARAGFHAVRRGVASDLHDKKVPQLDIQNLLGHKKPEMTQLYIRSADFKSTAKKVRDARRGYS